jgi:hypothetical protein
VPEANQFYQVKVATTFNTPTIFVDGKAAAQGTTSLSGKLYVTSVSLKKGSYTFSATDKNNKVKCNNKTAKVVGKNDLVVFECSAITSTPSSSTPSPSTPSSTPTPTTKPSSIPSPTTSTTTNSSQSITIKVSGKNAEQRLVDTYVKINGKEIDKSKYSVRSTKKIGSMIVVVTLEAGLSYYEIVVGKRDTYSNPCEITVKDTGSAQNATLECDFQWEG